MQSGTGRFWIWVLTGVLTLGVVILLNLAFRGVNAQLDLTEDSRYTLPDAAKRVAAGLEDTCKVTVYLSDPLPSYISFLPRALRTRLEEFRQASGEKLEYEFIAPEVDKNLMEELSKRQPPINPIPAADYVQGKQVSGSYYLTMVFRYGTEEIPFNLQELRNALLNEGEVLKLLPFQIAAKLVKLRNPNMKLGIASEKKIPPAELQNQLGKDPTDGLTTLRESIVRHLPQPQDVNLKGAMSIPELDTLMIARPDGLDERAIYEIDQFLMKGKRVIILLDNFSIFDVDRAMDLQTGLQSGSLKVREVKHGMTEWLAHYGIRVEDGYVDDASCGKQTYQNFERVENPPGSGRAVLQLKDYSNDLPGIIVANEYLEKGKLSGQFSETSPALAGLGRVAMCYPVPMLLDRDALAKHGTDSSGKARVEGEEILRTTSSAWVRKIADSKIQLLSTPTSKMTPPDKTEWGSRPLVVAISGNFKSFFAGKTYGTADRPPRKGGDGKEMPEMPNLPTRIDDSTAPGHLWVLADSDFASVSGGALVNNLRAQAVATSMAVTQAGLVNILDTLTVGKDLVDIRRPNLVDRGVDGKKVDDAKNTIKFTTVFLAPIILILIGFLWWMVRVVMTRVKSPELRPAPALSVAPTAEEART